MWETEAAEAAVEKVGEEVAEAREEREARKGRVLVALDREEAEWVRAITRYRCTREARLYGDPACGIDDKLRAALDTDREERLEREQIEREGSGE